MMLQAIFTDLDDTVAEHSSDLIRRPAWDELYLPFGYSWTGDNLKEHRGLTVITEEQKPGYGFSTLGVIKHMNDTLKLGDVNPEELEARRKAIQIELIRSGRVKFMPMPGAIDFFTYMHEQGIPLGLVTSGDAEYAQVALESMQLPPNMFDAIISEEKVKKTKPDPEAIFAALGEIVTNRQSLIDGQNVLFSHDTMEEIGRKQTLIDRENTILFGDSMADLGAGRAAGVHVFILETSHTTPGIREAANNMVIRGFNDPLLLKHPLIEGVLASRGKEGNPRLFKRLER